MNPDDNVEKPATYTCMNPKCEQRYALGCETTVHLFLDEPWYNHLVTECPACDKRFRIWDLHEATVRWLEQNNMNAEDPVQWDFPLDKAPVEVVKLFEKHLGVHDLTDHEEHEVEFYAWDLAQLPMTEEVTYGVKLPSMRQSPDNSPSTSPTLGA